jgi:hypothetical protein
MKAEGHCPDCKETLGVQIGSSVAALMGDTLQRLMDRDGNAMYCQTCDCYISPTDIQVLE